MQLKIKIFSWYFSFFVVLFFMFSCSEKFEEKTIAPPQYAQDYVDLVTPTSTEQTKLLLEGYDWQAIAFRGTYGQGNVHNDDSIVNVSRSNWVYRFSNDTGVGKIDTSVSKIGKFVVMGNGFLYSISGNKITLNVNKMILDTILNLIAPSTSKEYLPVVPWGTITTFYCLFQRDTMFLNEWPTFNPGVYADANTKIPMIKFQKLVP
jgi:hypothetical protein